MKTSLHCFPCLIRQCADLLERAISDEQQREEILRDTFSTLSRMDFELPAPLLSRVAYDLVVAATGDPDPLKKAKIQANDMALALLPDLRKRSYRFSIVRHRDASGV